MKKFRSLNCIASVCLLLLFIISALVIARSSSAASPSATKTVPVSVLGCPQGSPTPGLVPQYGGTLKLIYDRSIANLGAPWKVMRGNERIMGRPAIESLLGMDSKGEPIPQLATSWKTDPAKKTITFTLRKGVKFHDGTDFNAAAVKWNLDTYRAAGIISTLEPITSVDAIDDYHIRITLSTWNPYIMYAFNHTGTGAGKMISPTAAQKLGDKIIGNPVGTGPFKFVSYQPNVSIKYERFEGYWQKGLPYLDAIQINFVTDPVVALASFTRGEAHFIANISVADAKQLKAQGNMIAKNTTAINSICGDSKNPTSPFADIRVRRAIAYAIDNTTIVNSIYEGFSPPTNQLAMKGGTAYDATIKGYPYNPSKARELLAAAGYSTTKPLTTTLSYISTPQVSDIYAAMQDYLKKVGINLSLQPLDNAAFNKLSTSGWNDKLLHQGFSYNGVELKYYSSLTGFLSPAATSFVSIRTPDAFNTLYESMMSETNLAKKEAAYKKLNKMAIDDYCLVVPLFVGNSLHGVSPKAIDLGIGDNANAEFLPERAWLRK
jgi:peptide/nickel transport system substrate-binding protein